MLTHTVWWNKERGRRFLNGTGRGTKTHGRGEKRGQPRHRKIGRRKSRTSATTPAAITRRPRRPPWCALFVFWGWEVNLALCVCREGTLCSHKIRKGTWGLARKVGFCVVKRKAHAVFLCFLLSSSPCSLVSMSLNTG